MDFTRNVLELKAISYKCIFDKRSPMSGRVSAAIIYVAIRAGEIIDWWFPIKNISINQYDAKRVQTDVPASDGLSGCECQSNVQGLE